MLEKKTSYQIYTDLAVCDDKTEDNKVWVSEESLIKLLNNDLKLCRDVNLINYIGGLLEELKGDKE